MSHLEFLKAAIVNNEEKYDRAYADEQFDLANKLLTVISNLQQAYENEREYIRSTERAQSASKVIAYTQKKHIFLL